MRSRRGPATVCGKLPFVRATQVRLSLGKAERGDEGPKTLGNHESGDLPEAIGRITPRGNGESDALASLAS